MFIEDGMSWKTRFTNTLLISDKIWPNETDITLHLEPQLNNPDIQNITFEKYKYCFVKICQNSIFIDDKLENYQTFETYSDYVIDFPQRPVDQMVGVVFFSKLNAIGGDALKLSALTIESWQGENLSFTITQDSPEWDFVPNTAKQYYWWNDPEPNFSNFSKDRLTWEQIGFNIKNMKSHLTVIQGHKK